MKKSFLSIAIFIMGLLCYSLGIAIAKETVKINIDGVDKAYQKKIKQEPDLIAILESKSLAFNPIKLEKKLKDIIYLDGYLDAFIRLNFIESENKYHAVINLGERYKIASIFIDEPSSVFTPYHLIKIRQGDYFDGRQLIKAEQKILEFLTETECRYIKRVKHKIQLNEDNKTVDIIFDIGVSPSSVFGENIFNGLKDVDKQVLPPLVLYKKGACYTEQKINETIKQAINTNLFNNIYYTIKPHKKNEQGIAFVDVIYHLNERKHRTYNYGFGFSDTEAFIVNAGNQWRNLFNRGVSLDIQTRFSNRTQTLNLNGQYPSYFGVRENLNARLLMGRERFDTYNADGITFFSGYEKLALNNRFLSYGIGIRTNFSKVTESAIFSEEYFITALPLFALYDRKDSPLRPMKGYALRLDLIPAINMFSTQDNFFKNQAQISKYFNLGTVGDIKENAPTILAFNSKFGSILGTDIDDTPIIERFYAGGGGSVRGYNFQNLGDLQQGQPRGGTSLFEASIEARFGIGKSYGFTVFLDGGNVYQKSMPDIANNLQFAAGIGGRFYSSIIPIRFDIGFPLNPREGRGDNFGFYFGIGESF